MKKDDKVEFLNNKDFEQLKKMINEKGKYNILSYFSNFYDRRTYLKVNDLGDIEFRAYNPIVILFAFSNEIENLANYVFKYSYKQEKQILKKIDRMTNLTIPDLRLKLMKTLISGNLNFSKIFAKELYLRSKRDFFEVLYNFSFMGNPKHIKILYVYALEKIFSEINYDENILFVVISYLTKLRDDFSKCVEIVENKLDIESLKEKFSENIDKKIYLIICSLIFEKYDLKNKDKFILNIAEHFKGDFCLNEDLREVLMEL